MIKLEKIEKIYIYFVEKLNFIIDEIKFLKLINLNKILIISF